MKKLTLTAAIIAAASATSLMAQDLSTADADGNGTLSQEELLAVFPDMTADDFGKIDANGDGQADPDEIAAAQEAGLLPSGG